MRASPAKTWFQSPKGLVAGQYDGLLFLVAITGITYRLGIGDSRHAHLRLDQLGRRTQVGGAFARTAFPVAIASATYDGANELTNWNGTNLSYDANGNMLSDGVNTFTWNLRNQVAKLNNVALQYDPFGRRTKNTAGTSFLYDGSNAVQELSGSIATANLISGGIDEVFSRTDSSGAFTQLKDALGSTFALVDSSGNVQTAYTYDPFGNTSVTGAANTNEFQYTGQENEGNGLYFYRARYYAPSIGRFLSEDPLGVGAGINLYSYVESSPTNLVDPSGQQALPKPVPAPAPGPLIINLEGPAIFALASSEVQLGIEIIQTTQAINSENNAYDQLLQSIHNYNQAILAGRYTKPAGAGGGDGGDGGCYDDDDVAAAQQRYPKKAGKPEKHHIVPQYLGGPADGLTEVMDGAITSSLRTPLENAGLMDHQNQPLNS